MLRYRIKEMFTEVTLIMFYFNRILAAEYQERNTTELKYYTFLKVSIEQNVNNKLENFNNLINSSYKPKFMQVLFSAASLST